MALPRKPHGRSAKANKRRIVSRYEDGSMGRADGQVWDPDTKRWRAPIKPKGRK